MLIDYYLKCNKCEKNYIVQNVEVETIKDFVISDCPCIDCGNDKGNQITVLDIVWRKK